MKEPGYVVRAMSPSDLEIAVNWAAEEGWNPGLHDATTFYAADPGAYLMGFLDGEPIASISAVKYGGTFGFLGFYIVKQEERGKGYGMRIWNAALGFLEGRVIGLDGVVAQQGNYRKSGFELGHRNIRFEGVGGGQVPTDSDVVPLSRFTFDTVAAYDASFFPDDRSAFLRRWIQQPGCVALGIRLGGRLAGYGVLRACRVGYKIGPLFADTPAAAEVLFCALRAQANADEPIFLDAPETNDAAVQLAERYGMRRVFETARMYRGPQPELPWNRTFGVTTFELG